MCGIAGIVLPSGMATAECAKRMGDALAHRGPDGEGQWAEGPVALAHRRLAIIDTTATGAQPMHSACGRYVLSYNGEIYNFRELRRELEALGHPFRSRSDGEVLLASIAVWGQAALLRFNGMFAFALWDRQTETLLLARDRFGVKPLYWATYANGFAFASEQKALLALPAFSKQLDVQALREYFTFQNLFTNRTFFQGIHLFPAGHYAIIKAGDAAPRFTRYWDFHFAAPSARTSTEELREELDVLFRQAVKRQLVSDVEIGSYLSGGVDSGSITAIAARAQPTLKTFTCGFDLSSASGLELSFDERAKAQAMSARFGTTHYESVLKAGDMERVLPTLAWHLEEPRVGQSYPNYYAAQLARSQVKVVLSGAGGDELFAGYPWRYYRSSNSDNFDDYVESYYGFWQRLVPEDIAPALFAPIAQAAAQVDTRAIFRDVFANHANQLETPEDYVNHSLYFEAKTFLNGILIVEDKLSMAHGLETRVPFLDNDLVDFAMRCPVQLKLNNIGEASRVNENDTASKRDIKTSDGKQILRDVMARYVPSDVSSGAKQGFSAPDASWFKGESIEYVKSIVFNPKARIYDYLDAATTQSLVRTHLDGHENKRLFIWSLLNVEHFLRAYEV